MRELIEELQPKDYMKILLLIGLIAMLAQSGRIINYFTPKHKIKYYQIEALVTVLMLEPKYNKKETLEGSKSSK